MQCYNNLSKEEKAIPSVAERIGLTMKHAGVAITVTSLTNVFAFGIGAITVGMNKFGFYKLTFAFWHYFCTVYMDTVFTCGSRSTTCNFQS